MSEEHYGLVVVSKKVGAEVHQPDRKFLSGSPIVVIVTRLPQLGRHQSCRLQLHVSL